MMPLCNKKKRRERQRIQEYRNITCHANAKKPSAFLMGEMNQLKKGELSRQTINKRKGKI